MLYLPETADISPFNLHSQVDGKHSLLQNKNWAMQIQIALATLEMRTSVRVTFIYLKDNNNDWHCSWLVKASRKLDTVFFTPRFNLLNYEDNEILSIFFPWYSKLS